MGLVREPLDVDFIVDPRPLSTEEREIISDYICKYKALKDKKKVSKKFPKTTSRKKISV